MSDVFVLETEDYGSLRVHSDSPCYIQKSDTPRRSPRDYKQLAGLPDVKVNLEHLSQSRVDAYAPDSPFLCQDESFFSAVWKKGWIHALSGLLSKGNQLDIAPPGDESLHSNAGLVAKVIHYCKHATTLAMNHISQAPLGETEVVEKYAKALNWSEAIIRALAWHPHVSKLAVAFSDNTVRVYSEGAVTPLLKHKAQKGITDLCWKPYSGGTLAVACLQGVLLWHVEPSSLSTRPSTSSVQFLSYPGHRPVTSIAWAPNGSSILLTASPCDTSVLAWDVATERNEVLNRKGGKGNCLVLWSPDGTKILSTTPGPLIRVWETKSWTCEKWTSLPGRCSAACWSANGADSLLFSTVNEPVIFSIRFACSPGSEGRPSGSEAAVVIMDLREIELPAPVSERLVGSQFSIQSMSWDKNGGYVAALLTGEDCQGDIVVFRSKTSPAVELTVCGFILGYHKCYAQTINLDKQTSSGAVLTIGWSSGRVGYVPVAALSTMTPTSRPFTVGHRTACDDSSPSLFSL